MARTVELLLIENVDNLGIVGDVVRVKAGFARNYLLPFGYAQEPDQAVLDQLADKRKQAEKDMAELRRVRQDTINRLEGVELTMERSCNDQGLLYGSVTQQDISAGLTELGFPVKPREVRLPQTIKRLGEYHIQIKLDADLDAEIGIHVVPDRDLQLDERDEMEFDNEGNLIEKESRKPSDEAAPTAPVTQQASAAEADDA